MSAASDAADWIDRYTRAGGEFARLPCDGEIWFSVPDEAFDATDPLFAELRGVAGMRDAVRTIVEARLKIMEATG
ncbi:hypothetical protein ACH0BU_04230 [Sphingomonas olei]